MAIGKSVHRKEAWDKVTGKARYTDDGKAPGVLAARLLTSTCAHARIAQVDTSKAFLVSGVKAVLTGADVAERFGPLLQDRPALARDVVRYAGEPVALVVAMDEAAAEEAARLISVAYEPLPVLLTPSQAIAEGAPLLHAGLTAYKKEMTDVYPEAGTNIASRYRMRKGDAQSALKSCDFVAEQKFSLPPSDHAAMEVRAASCEISCEGEVLITTSSQAPYTVRKQISEAFMIPSGKIRVFVPFVGGGFGGKAPVTLEILAFLASRSVGGKAVRLTIPREQDMASMPCRIGLEAGIRIGANRDGMLRAAEMTYLLDCGAYTDIAPYMAKATAVDCTGPYRIDHLSCDALCVYTNHTYATSYRSFAHESYTFCVERTLDMLAQKCGIDPLEFRLKNAIRPGDLSPSQVECTLSLTGDLPQCLERVRALSGWDGGGPVPIARDIVRAKGVSCFWKTENPPTDAISGALLTFNPDGSVNLNTGAVEMGSGSQTTLAQIIAERLKIELDQVHVVMPVDTRVAPEHWKTVASLTGYMAGRAVLCALEDLIAQLRETGAKALCCAPGDIEVAAGRVFNRNTPERFIPFPQIVQGYKSQGGASVGEPALGRGGFMLKGLSTLDPLTGQGKTGPAWTLGAQVMEVEADLRAYTYRIVAASTAIDAGRAANPDAMRAMVSGGMAMGVSMASREGFFYDADGILQDPTLRTYKLLHIGQEPDYRVELVETPEDGAPYGMRSYSEHGIIGIPAALGNALSAAFGKSFAFLPLTQERIWKIATEESR